MHLCLFDIDGTILSADGAGRLALREMIQTTFGVADPKPPSTLAGRTDRAIVSELLTVNGLPLDEDTWRRAHDEYERLLPRVLAERSGLVYPGIPTLLDRLAERTDVQLGLLTGNFRSAAYQKLEHFGLATHFPFGGFGDDHPDRGDVARVALEEGRRHLGPERLPERVWVIGDTPFDVHCGRDIDATVVAVGTGFAERAELDAAGPDHYFDDLSEPERFLALLS